MNDAKWIRSLATMDLQYTVIVPEFQYYHLSESSSSSQMLSTYWELIRCLFLGGLESTQGIAPIWSSCPWVIITASILSRHCARKLVSGKIFCIPKSWKLHQQKCSEIYNYRKSTEQKKTSNVLIFLSIVANLLHIWHSTKVIHGSRHCSNHLQGIILFLFSLLIHCLEHCMFPCDLREVGLCLKAI